jgi:protocatechuate 3,4-dioxygenase beta subunit
MQINWKLAAGVIFLPAALLAQSTFGTILGTVTDSTGAVVPQAKIKITNQAENTSRATLTDSQGNYEALNLKAGVYTVSAEASGCRT